MFKNLTIILITLVIASCVKPEYVKPSGLNTAKLTITTKTLESINQGAKVFKDSNCSDYPGQLIDILQSKTAGTETKQSTTTSIKAGEAVTISVFAAIPRDDSFWEMFFKGINQAASENKNCEAFVSFVPEPQAKYHAIFKIDGSPCSINVMKIENGQGKTVTSSRTNQACSVKAKTYPPLKVYW